MIHTSIWASGQFSKLSQGARLTFIGIITLGDDDGRLKGSPSLIRSQLYPYDEDIKVANVATWIKEIIAQKLVVEYEIEDEPYLYHPKWEDYQNIREDRRRESHIPAPGFTFSEVTTKRQPNGNQVSTKRPPNISKDNISKDNKIDTVDKDKAFVPFWEKYPNKKSKKAAWKAWQKINMTPALLATIMAGLQNCMESEQWQKDDGRYIPHPATWINGERWEDVMTPGKKKNDKYDKLNTKTVRA